MALAGIAVMVVNTRTFDGWSIDMPSYTTGGEAPIAAASSLSSCPHL
eukprot:SAG11_NODE_11417_length_762_cov_1.004525_1_plen_47_part_00